MYYAKKLWGAGGGGGVVYDFEPFVAPESFDHPSKYADYGCTVNLYEKFRVYKMTYPGADIAVEFSDAIASVVFTVDQVASGSIIEVFETISGVETSVLLTTAGTHTFTSGSTKRYMIRRITTATAFPLPVGSVWAYCGGITNLTGWLGGTGGSPYLKYVFFYENTLTVIGAFNDTTIEGTLRINEGVTIIPAYGFLICTKLNKAIIGDSVTTIGNGAFYGCTSLQVADLGEGITSIGTNTFAGCLSLASIICRAYNPPTLETNAFINIPTTTNFYVPHERVAMYKAANGWSAFASRIYSINDL